MKILVTGANGMLGTALCGVLSFLKQFKVCATDINTSNADIHYLDVKDLSQVESTVKKFKPDIIFHLAAETDVDKCESHIAHAYIVNTLGTENLALVCLKYDIILVYVSTAAVFDGKKNTPYTEFDMPNPLSVYAKTKWEGEKIVQNLLSRYYIVRAGWMIGGIKKDKKFVAKIVNLANIKKELLAVTDKRGSPTFTEDMSHGLIKLISSGRFGLYHMANQGNCSRYEMACKIVAFMGKKNVVVKPVTSDLFPLPAPRGASEAIENFKLNLLGVNDMRHWEGALKEYVSSMIKSV